MMLNSSMDILLMLAIGALLGRFYSWMVSVHNRHEVIFGTVIGVAGALIGGFVLTRLFGVPPLTGGALAPSTVTICASHGRCVASSAATTAGIPYSRTAMLACDAMLAVSVTTASAM